MSSISIRVVVYSKIQHCLLAILCAGLVVVQINPIARTDLPRSIADINSRSNEISFNISMMREIAAIGQLHRVIDEIEGEEVHTANVRMHLISGTDTLSNYSHSSKYNTEWAFLSHLHDPGFAAADKWLAKNFFEIGAKSTLELEPIFQAKDTVNS
jgi:NTE family protein